MGLSISPLTIFDMQNLLAFIPRFNKTVHWTLEKCEDYTILMTTFNSKIPLKNIDYLTKYKSKIIICDDGSSNKEFIEYLNELERQGFKVIFNGHKKYIKWEFLKKIITIPSRELALQEGLEYVKTKYTIYLDDDSVPEDDLGFAVNCLKRENAQLSSVKVLPSNKNNLIESLQYIEYENAMLSRELKPYLTSGACLIGETKALKRIMKNHSMFYQGGDIEIRVLAKKLKMKVIHTDFKVYTEVPNTIKKWVKQRVYWSSGSFRHSVVNCFNYIKMPLHLIYFTGIVWLMLFFKWYYNFTTPMSLLIVFLIYIPITLINNLKIWSKIKDKWKYLFIFPLYAGFQVLCLLPIGIYLYFKQAILFKNFGIIKIRNR